MNSKSKKTVNSGRDTLAASRHAILASLFSAEALATLKLANITPSETEISDYREKLEQAYDSTPDTPLTLLCIKKNKTNLRWTLWIINDEPYLSLPAPVSQVNEFIRSSASKRAVHLVDGSTLRDKVFRLFLPVLKHDQTIARKEKEIDGLKAAKIPFDMHVLTSSTKEAHHLFFFDAPGEDLYALLFVQKKLSIEDTWEMFVSLCEKTASLHESGYCHMDIKPSNIVFDQVSKKTYLIDWESLCEIGKIYTRVTRTKGFAHPEVVKKAVSTETLKTLSIHPKHDIHCILATLECLFQEFWTREPEGTSKEYLKATYDAFSKARAACGEDQSTTTVRDLIAWGRERRDAYLKTLSLPISVDEPSSSAATRQTFRPSEPASELTATRQKKTCVLQ